MPGVDYRFVCGGAIENGTTQTSAGGSASPLSVSVPGPGASESSTFSATAPIPGLKRNPCEAEEVIEHPCCSKMLKLSIEPASGSNGNACLSSKFLDGLAKYQECLTSLLISEEEVRAAEKSLLGRLISRLEENKTGESALMIMLEDELSCAICDEIVIEVSKNIHACYIPCNDLIRTSAF